MGCSAMRPSTSRNPANGSMLTSSQEETKLRSTAAILPPLSLPKKVQLLRPTGSLGYLAQLLTRRLQRFHQAQPVRKNKKPR